MNDWFNNLDRREQWIYLSGAVIVVLYVLYMMLWSPVSEDIGVLDTRNAAEAEKLQWMRDSAKEIAQLRGTGTGAGASGGAQLSLSQMVNQAAGRQGFRISRMTPSGDREAQVWLDKVSFSAMLAWMDQMENGYGVSVKNISINNANAPGVVNVRVRFLKGI